MTEACPVCDGSGRLPTRTRLDFAVLVALDDLARNCGWASLKEMRRAVLLVRARTER